MQEVFWAKGTKVLLHWCKRELHRCKTGLRCKRLLGDLCSLGPKHLLHPLLTTLGTFQVSGPCSRHSGPQSPTKTTVGKCDPRSSTHTHTHTTHNTHGAPSKRQMPQSHERMPPCGKLFNMHVNESQTRTANQPDPPTLALWKM